MSAGIDGCKGGRRAPAGTYHVTDNKLDYTPRGYLETIASLGGRLMICAAAM